MYDCHAACASCLTSRQHLGGIFCCRTLLRETCKGMLQGAPHAASNGLRCMDLQNEQGQISLTPLGAASMWMTYCFLLTVRRSLELHIQLADVIVHEVYFPIAHHPARKQAHVRRQRSWDSEVSMRHQRSLQFHDVHFSALAGGRHGNPASQTTWHQKSSRRKCSTPDQQSDSRAFTKRLKSALNEGVQCLCNDLGGCLRNFTYFQENLRDAEWQSTWCIS